jgi:hypothetical protein
MDLPAELDPLKAAFPLGKIDTGEGLEPGLAVVVETLRPWVTEDFTVSFIAPGGLHNDLSGVEGWGDGWRDWIEAFDSYEGWLESSLSEPGVTVLLTRQSVRAQGGSVELEERSAVVIFWRGEKIRRIELHLDRDTALESAGLAF